VWGASIAEPSPNLSRKITGEGSEDRVPVEGSCHGEAKIARLRARSFAALRMTQKRDSTIEEERRGSGILPGVYTYAISG